ncbi:MAG: alkaline phosphatase family protein [Anaerolineae bacterium]|nr:alkaline phosphatase family protein [Anaerolineae bacterium]
MSTWFAERVLDVLGAMADAYYTRKYGAMARRLGRPGVAQDQRRGFIIIQIDGFSHEHLIQAVAAGHMPYLGRLLASRRLVVSPWRCGVPSTTPAVQAGIMFGNRFDIPGFRWYEKDRGQGIESKLPDSLWTMRARISPGHPGILRGGSCYVSMFDGDAEVAVFTLSTLHRQRFFESARGMGLFLLFLLSPFRVMRVSWLTVMRYLSKLSRRWVALVRPRVENPFDVFSPFLQALSETLFTEVQTFGVMLDIYRRAPAIYANYTIYDDVIHKAGLNHKAAFQTLRDIDKRIRQIDRMRARYRKRQYDLYVISDHGNTPSVPFSWLNGVSLARYIAAQVGQELSVDERVAAREHWVDKAHFLADELRGLEEASLRPRLRRVLAAVRRYVDRRVLGMQELDYNLARQEDVVVSASGPLAHVYFNVSPRPLDIAEVLILYPHLLDALLATPGVGAIVGRAGNQTLVLGHEGGSVAIGGEEERGEGVHPLAQFGDAAYAAAQLHYVTHFPHSGDLIVLGAMGSDGKVVAFEEQVAAHGGLGGPQIRPFIARPPECPLTPETVDDAVDLYSYFTRRYLEQPFSEGLSSWDVAGQNELARDVVAEAVK